MVGARCLVPLYYNVFYPHSSHSFGPTPPTKQPQTTIKPATPPPTLMTITITMTMTINQHDMTMSPIIHVHDMHP